MTTLEAWEKERERRTRGSNGGGAMSNDDVVQIPVVATVSCLAYRERIHELEAERDQLSDRCDKLREALEKILKCTLPVPMQDIARAALAEGGRDTLSDLTQDYQSIAEGGQDD
jgi:hypothetical protein